MISRTQHATPDTYMAEAKKTLEQATAFVQRKGSADAAAAIESGGDRDAGVHARHLRRRRIQPRAARWSRSSARSTGSRRFPKTWPKARVESKLREYNNYGLQELTIHEAMPGHYVQFEYANDVQPTSRRLLRNVFGNGAYVEGWAVYTQQMMSDEGYLDNSPALRLTLLQADSARCWPTRSWTSGCRRWA